MFESKIDSKIIGERLKEIRCYLGLSQQELCEKISIKQSQVSKIESGKARSLDVFLPIVEFYSQFIYINSLFDKDFILLSYTRDQDVEKSPINSVMVEILASAIKEHDEGLVALKKELELKIKRVKDLLR